MANKSFASSIAFTQATGQLACRADKRGEGWLKVSQPLSPGWKPNLPLALVILLRLELFPYKKKKWVKPMMSVAASLTQRFPPEHVNYMYEVQVEEKQRELA